VTVGKWSQAIYPSLVNSIHKGHLAFLPPHWQRSGYRVYLIFLQLQNEALAIERVAVRVAQGGHSVPEEVIRRRFKHGWRNFKSIYRELVDSWQLYDNPQSEIPSAFAFNFEIRNPNEVVANCDHLKTLKFSRTLRNPTDVAPRRLLKPW
jgi:hypothetical protein